VSDKKSVLILGNGKSRLEYKDFIKNWEDEIWACNRAFLELATGELPRLDRLIGDLSALKLAVEFKQKYDATFDIYVRKNFHLTELKTEAQVVTISDEYVKDSGTTFVVQALYENYDEIVLIGFDLGGPDIYIKNHELKNKKTWISRWKKIAKDFGLDRITFMGTDHKKFILSGIPSSQYVKKYIKGKEHLDKILKREDSVLILGNGTSRLDYKDYIQNWKGEIWVITRGYEEYDELPRIDRVGSVHTSALIKAYLYKIQNNLDYHIFSSKIIGKHESLIHVFDNTQGWASGPLMVQQALIEKYDDIQLLGFDFGGPDIYQDHLLYGGNFINQFKLIYKMYPNKVNIHFVGKHPGFLKNL